MTISRQPHQYIGCTWMTTDVFEPHGPPGFLANITMVWLCRCDVMDLHRWTPDPLSSQSTLAADMIYLIQNTEAAGHDLWLTMHAAPSHSSCLRDEIIIHTSRFSLQPRISHMVSSMGHALS